MEAGKLLIPSIRAVDTPRMRALGRHFKEAELDLMGLPPVLGRSGKAALSSAASLAGDFGMGIYSVHLRGLDLSTNGRKDASTMVRLCIQVQSILGPQMAVIHPGRGSLRALVSNLGFVAERIPPALLISVENLEGSRSLVSGPASIARFVEETGGLAGRVGVCIDTSHIPFSDMDSRRQTAAVLEHLGAAGNGLNHLHLSDRGRGKHLPIGKGIINWDGFDSFLEGAGYPGRAALEIKSDDVMDTVRSAAAYYSSSRKD